MTVAKYRAIIEELEKQLQKVKGTPAPVAMQHTENCDLGAEDAVEPMEQLGDQSDPQQGGVWM